VDVLVIDDEPDIRSMIRRVLESSDIRVVEAATGSDAMARAAESRFDVVVLDLHLPDRSGLDVLAELRAMAPSLHVIMLTGAGSESDRVRGLESGADDYMVKPFSVRELGARVVAVGRRLATPADEPEPAATLVVTGGNVAYASTTAVRMLGAERSSDVVGHDVLDFVAPESVQATMAIRAVAVAPTRPQLVALRRVDGEARLAEVSLTDVDWAGSPATEITLRDRARDPARLRELAGGLGPAHDAVIVSNAAMAVQSMNVAAEALYGWREDDAVGRPLVEVVPTEGEVDYEHCRRLLEAEGRWHGEVVKRRRDGTTIRVRVSTTMLRDDDGDVVGLLSVHRPVEDGADTTAEVDLDRELRAAVERDEFVVHYQPMVRLRDGRPLGVEALVRWQHPDRGLLPPAAFIGAAERSGAIVEIGQKVLEQACHQHRVWAEAGHDLHVAVNLSGRQLADATLPDRVGAVLAETGMPRGRLWLEVTETSLVDDLDRAADVLRRLDGLGAFVSIDDFGTGWASLTYLREFPVHSLKIDRVFVHGLGVSARDTAIVSSMLSLGRDLDLAVVAEGIETGAQRDRLVELGCELGQGFHFGRPEPDGGI
jgi:PAS domain S-box-containing protein